jgi:hypothetical protein
MREGNFGNLNATCNKKPSELKIGGFVFLQRPLGNDRFERIRGDYLAR